MRVLKFGGTSVGTPARMVHVLNIIIKQGTPGIVVLSAMANTTNKLKAIAAAIEARNALLAKYECSQLQQEYHDVVQNLLVKTENIEKGKLVVDRHFSDIKALIDVPFSAHNERIISAQGELISTELFYLLCQERGVNSMLLPALSFMKIDEDACPDMAFIEAQLTKLLPESIGQTIFITQGYICKNSQDEVDNLGRGGSDFTATIIGAAINADEIQIWTDIDGMHNNDPRYVNNTVSVPHLSYNEASMLAYFGAKILHPLSVIPAMEKSIPLILKNTFEPDLHGTVISDARGNVADCVVSVKENEVLLTIQSNNQLPVGKFLLKVIEIFNTNRIEIDMISIAHQSVAIVISGTYLLKKVLFELSPFGEVDVESDFSIVSVVGKFHNRSNSTLSQVFRAIRKVPVRMVSQKREGDSYLLLLIKSNDKIETLQMLNTEILNNQLMSRISASMVM